MRKMKPNKVSDILEIIMVSLSGIMVATIFLYLIPKLVYAMMKNPNFGW